MSELSTTVRVEYDRHNIMQESSAIKDAVLSFYRKNDRTTKVRDMFSYDMLIGIPNATGKSYHKTAMECLVNLLCDFTQSTEKSANNDTFMLEPNKQISKDGIPLELMHEVRRIANTLQYIVNSTSWRDETEYHDFDKFEIGNKLGRR